MPSPCASFTPALRSRSARTAATSPRRAASTSRSCAAAGTREATDAERHTSMIVLGIRLLRDQKGQLSRAVADTVDIVHPELVKRSSVGRWPSACPAASGDADCLSISRWHGPRETAADAGACGDCRQPWDCRRSPSNDRADCRRHPACCAASRGSSVTMSDVVGIESRELLDLFGPVAVMRQRMERRRDAALRIDARTDVAAHLERRHARHFGGRMPEPADRTSAWCALRTNRARRSAHQEAVCSRSRCCRFSTF